MNAVVHKPLDLEKLSKALAQVVERRPAHGSSPRAEVARAPHTSDAHRGRPLDVARRRAEAEARIERTRAEWERGERRTDERKTLDASVVASAPEPLFDLDDLRKRVGGDAELAAEVLAAVVSDSLRIKGELDAALAGRDAAVLRRAAHTLKGCLANVAANALVQRCAALEEAARAGELEACDAMMPALEELFAQVHAGLAAASLRRAA
jgi:HPt (histidine-containing phosphotransfer) domain-containing protein